MVAFSRVFRSLPSVSTITKPPGPRGYESYSPLVLSIYDAWVHGLNNRYFWKCPTEVLLAHYRKHLSANHLEIGPGTGFLIDRCGMPGERPRLVLCDMNPNCLAKAGERLARFHPGSLQRDVLAPIEGFGEPFDSVGMNYVLHCLPGDMLSKRAVLEHVAACLKPGGTLFGSTLLSIGVRRSMPARLQYAALNAFGSLSNRQDSLAGLEASLRAVFADAWVEVRGCAALFCARR